MSHHYVRRKIVSEIDSAWFYCPKINLQVDLKAKLKRPKKGLKSFQNVEYLNIQTKLGTDFHMLMSAKTVIPSHIVDKTFFLGLPSSSGCAEIQGLLFLKYFIF